MRRDWPLLPIAAGLACAAVAGVLAIRHEPSIQYRLLLWWDGLRAAVQAPWGAGAGQFSHALDSVLSSRLDQVSWERNIAILHPHSIWVETLVERGILGAAGIGIWVRNAIAAARRPFTPALIAFAAIASFSVVSRVPALWMLGGVALGATLAHPPVAPRWPMRGAAVLVGLAVALVGVRQLAVDVALRNGLAAARAGDDTAARRHVAVAAGRDGWGTLADFNHGLLQWRAGQLHAAANAFRELAGRRPKFARAYELLTLVALADGRPADAAAATDTWRHLPGYRAPAVFTAGVLAYARAGRRQAAESLLVLAIAEHPKNDQLRELRRQLQARPGRRLDPPRRR